MFAALSAGAFDHTGACPTLPVPVSTSTSGNAVLLGAGDGIGGGINVEAGSLTILSSTIQGNLAQGGANSGNAFAGY